MNECKLCGEKDDELNLLSASHKELGRIMIRQECWAKLYKKNRMIYGTTSSVHG